MSLALPLAALTLPPPSMARTVEFAGLTWDVRAASGKGPGNRCWNDSTRSVKVDSKERLRLRARRTLKGWCQAEVRSQKIARFGEHLFQIITSGPQLHEFEDHVVIGLFLYRDDDHEIDIELTRSFGDERELNGWHVVQRSDSADSIRQGFSFETSGTHTSHLIRWQEGRVEFVSYHGHCLEPPCGGIIAWWEYRGEHVPHEDDELRVHLQIWINQTGNLRRAQEIIVANYRGSMADR